MKKFILHSTLFLFAVLLGTILSASLPKIDIEVSIESNNHSIVQAQDADNSGEGQLGCNIWSSFQLDEITEWINSDYRDGYRFKQFFVLNEQQGDTLALHYVVTCRD